MMDDIDRNVLRPFFFHKAVMAEFKIKMDITFRVLNLIDNNREIIKLSPI